MMVAGSFGLQQFSNLRLAFRKRQKYVLYTRTYTPCRYQYYKKQPVTPEEMKKYGVNMKKRQEVTLETEYDKVKNVDIDNWENKRGPRPWEEEGQTTAAKH
ncbi:hypothetical protein KR054_009717 [Drosophila jambulina]|nr:hypothetical protein KR054_009717 [Drosophila jambulina]